MCIPLNNLIPTLKMMRITWIVLFLLHSIQSNKLENKEHSIRQKRQVNSIPLVFPYGATYKLLIGFSLPVPMKDKINLAFAANFQYQYLQYQNVSQLSRYYFIKKVPREQREAIIRIKRNERLMFYKTFASLLEAQGMNGKECVLRAICEAAQYPVEEEGLVGELMHILLTPDYGHSAFEASDPDWQESISSYKDAATAGRQMFHCPSIYKGCPEGQGVLELVTKLRDH